MAQQNQNEGWNVISTAPIPKPTEAQDGGWNVVSTAPIAKPAVDMSKVAGAGGPLATPSTRVAPPVALQGPPANPGSGFWKGAYDASPLPIAAQALTHPINSIKNVTGALNPNNIGNDAADDNPILRTVGSQVPCAKAIRTEVGNLYARICDGSIENRST
jgi:hypothetical protein